MHEIAFGWEYFSLKFEMTISGCIYQTEPISRMQSSQISSENVVYNLFVCEVVKSVVLCC